MTGLNCKIIQLFTIGERSTVTKTARINLSHLFGGPSAPPLPTHTAAATSHNLSEFFAAGSLHQLTLNNGPFKIPQSIENGCSGTETIFNEHV